MLTKTLSNQENYEGYGLPWFKPVTDELRHGKTWAACHNVTNYIMKYGFDTCLEQFKILVKQDMVDVKPAKHRPPLPATVHNYWHGQFPAEHKA